MWISPMAVIQALRALSIAARSLPISSSRCTRGATPRLPSASAVATVTASSTDRRILRVTTCTSAAPMTIAARPASPPNHSVRSCCFNASAMSRPLSSSAARVRSSRSLWTDAVRGWTSRSRRPTVTILFSSVCSDWIASRSAASCDTRSFNSASALRDWGIAFSACATASRQACLPSWYCRPCELRRVSVHATALNVNASQFVRILPMTSRCTCATRTWSNVARLCRSWNSIIAMLSATSTTNPMGSNRNRRCRLIGYSLDRDFRDQGSAEGALGLLQPVLRVAGNACRAEVHRVIAHHRVAVALDDRIEAARGHELRHVRGERRALHDFLHGPIAVDELAVAVGGVGLDLAAHQLVEVLQHLGAEERRHERILAALGEVALEPGHDRGEGLEVGAARISDHARRLGVERGAGGFLVTRPELAHERIGSDLFLRHLAAIDHGLQVADDPGAFADQHPQLLGGLLRRVLG